MNHQRGTEAFPRHELLAGFHRSDDFHFNMHDLRLFEPRKKRVSMELHPLHDAGELQH